MSEVREPIKKSSIKKKEKIIKKGFELMCEKGYHNVNSVDIAKYSGVSTGCIYQYFPDKKAIFIEGSKIYLKDICFPMLEVFEWYSKNEMSVEELVSYILENSIQKQTLSYKAHQELMSMCYLDQDVAQIFNQNEIEVTSKIVKILKAKNCFKNNSKESIHLFIHIVNDFIYEKIYHKHSEYDYNNMYKETKKILVYLLKKEAL